MDVQFDTSSQIARKCVYWALLNGIVVDNSSNADSVVHAPVSLSPYLYPAAALEEARSLAPLFNKLVHAIAREGKWLVKILERTAQNDEFTGRLLAIYKEVDQLGVRSPITLGLHRSDYMLHAVEGDPRQLMQVELNTIASSFGALSSKIFDMHRTVHQTDSTRIPHNEPYIEFARGIAAAHGLYLSKREQGVQAKVAIIVQPEERNIADQWMLQFALLERHGIATVRYTLEDIHTKGMLEEVGGEGTGPILVVEGVEVSVVYFRAGYTPTDYPSDDQWAARRRIEMSRAVKCPDIAYHLVGAKKVQQALAGRGQLERFLSPPECAALRQVFAGLYSLDELDTSPEEVMQIMQTVRAAPYSFVMKPQREGGGNNLYDEDIVVALDTYSPHKLSSFILMERILPPSQPSTLMRRSVTTTANCVCELGVFSVYLVDDSATNDGVSTAPAGGDIPAGCDLPLAPRGEVLMDLCAGFLLRVKPEKENEGGVAAGFAVLSSPYLI